MPRRRRTWSSVSIVRPSCTSFARRARSSRRCRNSTLRRRSRKSSARWSVRSLRRAARTLHGRLTAALVAGLALVTLTTIFFIALRDETAPPVAERIEPQVEPVEEATLPIDVETARVPELVAQSRRLEDLLQQLPERPRIE